MVRASKTDEQQPTHAIVHEIWGIVYAALGILVLISLVSRYAGNPEILGPIVGRRLSQGLFVLFGPVAVLLVPAGILLAGWEQVRGRTLTARALTTWSVLILEVAALLAVRNIVHITGGAFPFTDNYVGNAIVYLLHFVFGPHPLGPYFLLAVGFVISILLAFKVNARLYFVTMAKLLRTPVAWLGALIGRHAPHGAEATEPDPDAADTADDNADVEDEERQRRLEEELAAFRARKNEPITITTHDPEPPDADDDEVDKEVTAGAHGAGFTPSQPKRPSKPYRVPSADILDDPPPESSEVDRDHIEENSATLERTLLNFGVEGKVVNVSPGPVINRYEIELAPGIKVSKVVNLQDDISLAVGGLKIRIQAPIPGKSAVGIELPNPQRQIVHFKHVLLSDAYRRSKAKLPVVIGKGISGVPFVTDINRMPHLLIAGQTGSGKSVCINCILCSLLMTKTPEELRMILVDPKKVELAVYDGIPHLMSPVVTESKEAVKALQWAVAEMERRYRLLANVGARDIESFNNRVALGKITDGAIGESDNKLLPFIVIIVDELADLMMTASRDVETLIMRIAQLARAVGIHLIVATQRPSVDIITGPIKANLTSRIAFRTIQSTDSRTILGHVGAEKLLGMGDMLFLRSGAPDIERYHGAFLTEEDVERVVTFIRGQYVEVEKIESFEVATATLGGTGFSAGDSEGRDELFADAARVVVGLGQGSTSLLQRRMKIGYARAGRLMDELERAGIVGPQEGSKVREVLVRPDELDALLVP